MSSSKIEKPFSSDFSLIDGLSKSKEPLQRKLSNMRGMVLDEEALEKMIAEEDRLVYEFYDMKIPETPFEVQYGTSITYPGKFGDEYFMTKGHFHNVLDTSEVYYCLKGHGYMLMETPEGEWDAQEMKPGIAVYVPGRWAHRSINCSPDEALITFFAFRGDAGHDYGTIETKGFRKVLVERDGRPEFIDNPRWKS
jgi:glucose-6-phosphate isomerase